jgi:hypothetical protein
MAVFIVHSYQSAPEIDPQSLIDALLDGGSYIQPTAVNAVKKVTSR